MLLLACLLARWLCRMFVLEVQRIPWMQLKFLDESSFDTRGTLTWHSLRRNSCVALCVGNVVEFNLQFNLLTRGDGGGCCG